MTADTDGAPVPPELPELVEFASARGRPAVLVILDEAIARPHLLTLREELGSRRFEELDFVIHSRGGNIDIAYQIVH